MTRKPGRPRGTAPFKTTHSCLTAWVPNAEYDLIAAIAKKQDRTVSATAGMLLRVALKRTPGNDHA